MFSSATFPHLRMRRLRKQEGFRNLRAETQVTAADLIYPVFVTEGKNLSESIASMPEVCRKSLDLIHHDCEAALELGIPAVSIFPVIASEKKSLGAEESFNPEGLVQRCVREIKAKWPELGVITDVALDPYTTHGQDGLMNQSGQILNDETVAVLSRQACSHAAAGADVIAPSDMMDGRIGVIRKELDKQKHHDTMILSYAAKYASHLYGPFRDAVGSKKALGTADKRTYQMNPANTNEALWEAGLDIAEGADMIMVKPGLHYLDVIWRIKEQFKFPTLAYHVSGEYSMIKAAAKNGWIDEQKVVLETLLAFKRAGSDGILTYYALQAAKWIKENQ